ncbi:hypothetical protein, partial [Thiolapillus sp.]
MTRTAGAQIGCQRLSRFWGLGCPKIYHEAEDTLGFPSGAMRTTGKQCGLTATGDYQPSLRSPWLAAVVKGRVDFGDWDVPKSITRSKTRLCFMVLWFYGFR